MSLRSLYYSLSPSLRLLARKIVFTPIDLLNSITRKRSKYEPPKGDIYIGSGDFIKQGEHHLELLKRFISLKQNDAVLDVGSGIGRTAVALTKYLNNEAKYEGFDVVEKGVNWCKKGIQKDFSNFNFTYIALENDLYNNSIKKASEFHFPFKKNTFDKVFLFSVFTHMKTEEIAHYLKEINRVLKPNGECLATFFIYDNSQEKIISNDNNNFVFKYDFGNYKLMNKKVVSANIALKFSYLCKIVDEANLEIKHYEQGYWKKEILKFENIDFQDIIVLKKN